MTIYAQRIRARILIWGDPDYFLKITIFVFLSLGAFIYKWVWQLFIITNHAMHNHTCIPIETKNHTPWIWSNYLILTHIKDTSYAWPWNQCKKMVFEPTCALCTTLHECTTLWTNHMANALFFSHKWAMSGMESCIASILNSFVSHWCTFHKWLIATDYECGWCCPSVKSVKSHLWTVHHCRALTKWSWPLALLSESVLAYPS